MRGFFVYLFYDTVKPVLPLIKRKYLTLNLFMPFHLYFLKRLKNKMTVYARDPLTTPGRVTDPNVFKKCNTDGICVEIETDGRRHRNY